MATLETLSKRVESTKELQSVVKTMKAIAAVSIRQYERAVQSLEAYNQVLEMGFQIFLQKSNYVIHDEPYANNRTGIILFGSDQGMCGQFNEDVLEFTLDKLNEVQVSKRDRSMIALGFKLKELLRAYDQKVDDTYMLPGSTHGITASVQELLFTLEAWQMNAQIEQIIIFYNKKLSGSSYRPTMQRLLPLDANWLKSLQARPWPTRNLPTYFLERNQLLTLLIRQFFFVALFNAFAESLASENASRLAAMQAAEKNIDEQLQNLNMLFNHQRQSAITSELLDIVSGFEALQQN
ncbi:F0F1 ATP synthase subunit gamma [candidate division KSB1 bacterium]|nr:F0F1 ATP synthase subunit gamma [candidate division KSB1 bacterium]